MYQVIPMTLDEALKASESYRSTINGDMVQVLADGVRKHRDALDKLIAAASMPLVSRDHNGLIVFLEGLQKAFAEIQSTLQNKGQP